MVKTLANALVGTGTQPDVSLPNTSANEGVAQATASGTSTVVVQGNIPPCTGWVDVATLTNSEGKVVALYPKMRANVTANSGTVTVALSAPT